MDQENTAAPEVTRIELPADGPGGQAAWMLRNAMAEYVRLLPGSESQEWIQRVANRAIRGISPGGDALVQALADPEQTGGPLPAVIAAILICIGYAGQAVRAEHGTDMEPAWKHALMASHWLGVCKGISSTFNENAQTHFESWAQQQKSKKRWGTDRAQARAWARNEYTKNGSEYRSKMDFARHVMRYVLTQFELVVTETTVRDDWLKGL